MKPKLLTFILAVLFSFSSFSVSFADNFQDGVDAYERGDYKTAYKLFLPVAEQGDAEAQCFIGICYENGRGVKQDDIEAEKWYRKSAAQGFRDGQSNLGFFIYEQCENGVIQNYSEAVMWLKKSAENGDPEAQFRLGAMYVFGKGVVIDLVQAYKWMSLGIVNGYEDKACNRKLLQNKMTQEQILKADKEAFVWMEKSKKLTEWINWITNHGL